MMQRQINSQIDGDDEVKIISIVQRELFAVTGSVNREVLSIGCFFVTTEVETISDVPSRVQCNAVTLEPPDDTPVTTTDNSLLIESVSKTERQMVDEVQYLAPRFLKTLGL